MACGPPSGVRLAGLAVLADGIAVMEFDNFKSLATVVNLKALTFGAASPAHNNRLGRKPDRPLTVGAKFPIKRRGLWAIFRFVGLVVLQVPLLRPARPNTIFAFNYTSTGALPLLSLAIVP